AVVMLAQPHGIEPGGLGPFALLNRLLEVAAHLERAQPEFHMRPRLPPGDHLTARPALCRWSLSPTCAIVAVPMIADRARSPRWPVNQMQSPPKPAPIGGRVFAEASDSHTMAAH